MSLIPSISLKSVRNRPKNVRFRVRFSTFSTFRGWETLTLGLSGVFFGLKLFLRHSTYHLDYRLLLGNSLNVFN